ncbi:uncharacterized protein A1O9_04286 [Exophiala aquamarina CBS 119918]|uniref:MmgE/PrpD family protein n=1 Tax=Exophiala aquamarina CBS 119918 TaxID=1182545 RepID=A0A072PI62_9EURO|nr:uncharacterized protein A1O9_04286 [Exophiala aquamarina CBS 119918]KEF59442.1 hypothetical protein A1O9_04286 [Exophiala aquamarina CBS 119918]
MGEVDHTLLLAEFLSKLTYEDLTQQVIIQAKKSMFNSLGCGLGYAQHGPAEKAFSMIQAGRARGEATILGRKERTGVEHAILINGIALTTADYDDTHLKTVIHPSGTPLAALLSWAEVNHISGKEFLLAFICGVEAQCAVGNAISPAHYRDGWHITGTTGNFGATAAIAKAQKLSSSQFAAAFGHSASMAGGIRAMFGTDTKTLHMGRGAQNGLLSAQLASHGFESCPKAIERWGRMVSTTVSEESLSALAHGGAFQILENTFKPYPCGIVIHPLIDAGLQAHVIFQRGNMPRSSPMQAEQTVDSTTIETIDATVNPQCVRLCSVRNPATGLETIFSLYHGIAVALLYGQAGRVQFSDKGCKDELTKQIRDKIQVHTDEKVADDAAILKLTFIDKQQRVISIDHATGSLANPMTSEQLEAKFMDLSSDILGEARAHEVVEKCWNIEEIINMQDFVQSLVPA